MLTSPYTYTSRTIVPSRLFTAATGTAILTELLYRLLLDIINRVLDSAQTLASRGLDNLTSYLEQRRESSLQARRLQAEAEAQARLREDGGGKDADGGKSVLWEVKKMVDGKGAGGIEFACPKGAGGKSVEFACPKGGMRPGPPMWARGVLEGIEEGRMQDRDFWIQTHEG